MAWRNPEKINVIRADPEMKGACNFAECNFQPLEIMFLFFFNDILFLYKYIFFLFLRCKIYWVTLPSTNSDVCGLRKGQFICHNFQDLNSSCVTNTTVKHI
jgi:hypothetical protein